MNYVKRPPFFDRDCLTTPVAVELHRARNNLTVAGLYFFGFRIAYWVMQ